MRHDSRDSVAEQHIECALDLRFASLALPMFAVASSNKNCRVNDPGETDDAKVVNLKRSEEEVGAFSCDEILGELKLELDNILDQRA